LIQLNARLPRQGSSYWESLMGKSVVLWIAVLAVGIVGCSHRVRPTPPSTANTTVPSNESSSQTSGAANPNAAGEGVLNGTGPGVQGPTEPSLQDRTIYFDFDSSEIKGQYDAMVTAHARYLVAHPNVRVRLEGNTDERGSREYNIGLGARRAQSVRQALMLQGVADSQITTVSYGEEHPAVTGHNDAAWARNRRVDIMYLN